MSKQMLIDASHSEETRVAVLEDGELVEFQHEISGKTPIKGNIFLAKVIRVEPSLQAAFVDYGANRHGFLGFNEIHPDYYKIPIADRQEILANYAKTNDGDDAAEGDSDSAEDDFDLAETMGSSRFALKHRYKIQEVIKRGQIILVQAVKEERGNKGAAMTSFISLAGRYCVLMPNSGKGGGVSRRINDDDDRRRLKDIVASLDVADSMALIVRTAGAERTKPEIKRDYEYLSNLWAEIRKITIDSQAPALVHEDVNILWRSIRDVYDKDTDKIIIQGEESYNKAREYMKMLVPTHVKRIEHHKDTEELPIYQKYHVENLLATMYQPVVFLPSGGSIVIEQTEALVAIDVNSGRATQERHIEETALNTNMEAAEAVALQARLRDLSGLIIIDFIDMEERRNNIQLERHFKDMLAKDRARMQVNRISSLGLLEMTRQRLNPSLSEVTTSQCPHCYGTGKILNINATVLMIMRSLEQEAIKNKDTVAVMNVKMSLEVAIMIFNSKRQNLQEIETANQLQIVIEPDPSMPIAALKIYATATVEDDEIVELSADKYQELFNNYDSQANNFPRRRNRTRGMRSRRKSYSGDEQGDDSDNQDDGGDRREDGWRRDYRSRDSGGRRDSRGRGRARDNDRDRDSNRDDGRRNGSSDGSGNGNGSYQSRSRRGGRDRSPAQHNPQQGNETKKGLMWRILG